MSDIVLERSRSVSRGASDENAAESGRLLKALQLSCKWSTLMNNDQDPIPPTREQPSLARLIAVVGGVMGFFGFVFWVAQE